RGGGGGAGPGGGAGDRADRSGVTDPVGAAVRHLGGPELRPVRTAGDRRLGGAVPEPGPSRRGGPGQAGGERAGDGHRRMTAGRPGRSGPALPVRRNTTPHAPHSRVIVVVSGTHHTRTPSPSRAQ